jgi:butyryl-CoA dehydrogenase/acyl-CoA dehydrogenase
LKEVLPLANRLDPEREDMPRSLIDKLGQLGYFGITIAEKHGGMGLGCFEYCLVAEELSRAWMSVGSIIARGNTFMGSQLLSEEQRGRIFPRMATGEYLGALALSEPGAGSDLANVSCRARRDGNDWLITGNKYWCTFADGADFIFVLARTRPEVDRKRSMPASAPSSSRSRVVLSPPGSPARRYPRSATSAGRPGSWLSTTFEFRAMRWWARKAKRLPVSRAGSKSTARTRLRDRSGSPAARSKTPWPTPRKGAVRPADRQLPGHPFQARADGDRDRGGEAIELLRLRTDRQGLRCDTEAAMTKLFASEMSERVCSEALQVFGGAGYTTHHAVERYWRDARLTRIFEGTSEIQMKIISDRMLGRPPVGAA